MERVEAVSAEVPSHQPIFLVTKADILEKKGRITGDPKIQQQALALYDEALDELTKLPPGLLKNGKVQKAIEKAEKKASKTNKKNKD